MSTSGGSEDAFHLTNGSLNFQGQSDVGGSSQMSASGGGVRLASQMSASGGSADAPAYRHVCVSFPPHSDNLLWKFTPLSYCYHANVIHLLYSILFSR